MTLKEATANSLLMFVAATCVVLIVKAIVPLSHAPQAEAGGRDGGERSTAADDGVRVYYLHGSFRCPTCRTIEAYAKEAVESGFAEELRDGRVAWQVINYEEPGNERFAIDYEVVAPTVVLAKFEGGRQVDWKGLHEVWEHVGDKDAFLNFVQSNLRQFAGTAADQTPPRSQAAPPSLPAFGVPLPVPSSAGPPVPPLPAMPSDAAQAATAEMPEAAAREPEPILPASPLRSPTDTPESFLPTPKQ
ncbi:MAG: nitrophenyl compound nitroreductase subunit ArsF family protein [Patescibacteria group bacterium]|nr:nitrophenyl compound nitroreductase subunit ArsF family protein [Patescibacteria group bacterium]